MQAAALGPVDLGLELRRHQALLEITDLLGHPWTLPEFIHELVQRLRTVATLDFVVLALHDPTEQVMRLRLWEGSEAPPAPRSIAVEESASGWVWRNQQPLAMDDIRNETRFPAILNVLRDRGVRSYCMLPLTTRHARLGALGFGSDQVAAFGENGLSFLQKVVKIVALVAENRQAHRALLAEQDHLRSLLEVSQAINSGLDLDELLAKISAAIQKVLPHDTAVLGLYDSTANAMQVHMLTPPSQQPGFVSKELVSLEGSVSGRAFLKRATQNFGRDDLSDMHSEFGNRVLHQGVNSVCATPLATSKRVLGSLSVYSKRVHAFAEADLRVLELIASQVAIALEVAEQDRLRSLLEVGQDIHSSLDMNELLAKVAAAIQKVLPHDFAVLGLYDEAAQAMQVHMLASPTRKPGIVSTELVTLEGSVSGRAFLARATQNFGREDLSDMHSEFGDRILHQGVNSVCATPLAAPKRLLGSLSVYSKRVDAFAEADQRVLEQVASQVAVAVENALAYREISGLKDRLAVEKLYLEGELENELQFDEIVGKSPLLRKVLSQARTVAPTDATVLILGETGTGKELVARAIHRMSLRKDNNFIKLNCAAIPTGLLESELFGHEKGAFTGAISPKIGRLELADKGTLFLDEVGDIPLELQPKLLRVLQDQEFERIGSNKTIRVDVRVISATNQNLDDAINEKRFRRDLYYRLHVFPITLPALRERPEDIPPLVRHFVKRFAKKMAKDVDTVSRDTMNTLSRWRWPGNVRELENFMERSVILTTGRVLHVPVAELAPEPGAEPEESTLDSADRAQIDRALKSARGILSGPRGAAARLGLKRTTLQSKLRRLGIKREKYFS